jgi:hypothetical protein
MFKAKSNFKIMKNSLEIEMSIPSEQINEESQASPSLLSEVNHEENELVTYQNPLKKYEIRE